MPVSPDWHTFMNCLPLVAASMVASGPLVPASSSLNDYNASTDAAETVMVLARSEAEFKNATILTSTRKGSGWSEPVPIDFADKTYNDSDPWLTPDGKTLYFISDRPAPGRDAERTDYDIWRARRSATGWSAPEHLGEAVNSRGQELGPEVHDATLYFASARRSGLGGLDIYAAALDGDGFTAATLLDGPFNSQTSDSDFTLNSDGSAALFWRMISGVGSLHIAYRTTTGQWTQPIRLGSDINIGPFNFTPSFTNGGLSVRYASTLERPGQSTGYADIYEAALPDAHSVRRSPNSR